MIPTEYILLVPVSKLDIATDKTDMIPALRHFRSTFLTLDWFRPAYPRL